MHGVWRGGGIKIAEVSGRAAGAELVRVTSAMRARAYRGSALAIARRNEWQVVGGLVLRRDASPRCTPPGPRWSRCSRRRLAGRRSTGRRTPPPVMNSADEPGDSAFGLATPQRSTTADRPRRRRRGCPAACARSAAASLPSDTRQSARPSAQFAACWAACGGAAAVTAGSAPPDDALRRARALGCPLPDATSTRSTSTTNGTVTAVAISAARCGPDRSW